MDTHVIKSVFYCFLVLALWSTFSCNDPASIGTGLIDGDVLDIQNDSDFEITAFTVEEDSIVAYQPGLVLLGQYPFGIYEDPIFGTTTASIVSQVYITTISPPTFVAPVVDSVVMQIAWSDTPTYGDTTNTLGLEVYEVTETLDAATTYYTNYVAETSTTMIGSYEGVPNFRDSIEVTRIQGDTIAVDTFPPFLTFRLDNDYGSRILNSGEDVLTSPSSFTTMFQGLELRPTIPSSGMVAFDFGLFSGAVSPSIDGANILIYYTEAGVSRQYNLTLDASLSVKFEQYNQDYAGSPVEEFIGDEVAGDSLVFVQGMNGTNAVIRLDDVNRLNGSLINGATLEVFGTALNGDEELRPVPEQLVLRQLEDDGDLPFIRDFTFAANSGSLALAGGVPEDMGNGIFKYSFEIGAHLQDIIEGESPDEIFIRTISKIANLNRVVLFGPGHSTYPMKLNVTYTKL